MKLLLSTGRFGILASPLQKVIRGEQLPYRFTPGSIVKTSPKLPMFLASYSNERGNYSSESDGKRIPKKDIKRLGDKPIISVVIQNLSIQDALMRSLFRLMAWRSQEQPGSRRNYSIR